MRILVARDMAQAAAGLIAGRIQGKPDLTVTWCTGRTVIPVYGELVRLHRDGQLLLDRVRSFDLDEYYGLAADHPASYRRFLEQHLLVPTGHRPTRLLDGSRSNWRQECADFEAAVAAAGGTDLLLDGIGANAHLGFNEPSSPFGSGTRVVDLTAESREGQLAFFPSIADVPRQALTRGIRPIMNARSIMLMAAGEAKARPLALAFLGPVTEAVPCSVLQLHPDLTLVLDRAAAEPLLANSRTACYVQEVGT
jgi:glucosamine-6-phosphate deaminase